MVAAGRRAAAFLDSALLIAVLGLLVLAEPAYASTYTVNSFGDDPDMTPGDDDCTDLNGRCSLRAAIQEANAHAGPDAIHFNIPGPVPRILSLASPLPDITGPVTIDGLTQGNIACPLPSGSLNIQIDGNGLAARALKLFAGSDGSIVRGLSITRFDSALDVAASNTTIACNAIGVEADGSDAGTNGHAVAGITIGVAGATGNVIGGPAIGGGNLIAHNRIGVWIANGAHGNSVVGNVIRDSALDNVAITNTSVGNLVSQTRVFNGGTGAADLGIDLGADGVSANDVGDGDTGPNNLQNFPVLVRARSNGSNTAVAGTLNSISGETYRIEFFSNAACDASGNGEGETYLGATDVTVDSSNPNGVFSIGTLPAIAAGQVITATASRTAAPLDTSEFSACQSLGPPAGVMVTEIGGTTAVAEGGAMDTLSVVLRAPPAADVTVAFTTGTQLQGIASLTFTPANWNAPQSVTVAATDDSVAEGAHSAPLAFVVTSADAGYNGSPVPNISVTITDNDIAGVTVDPTSGLTTTEAGGTATFTVRLNTVPTAPVTVAISSSDTTEGMVSPASLTFAADATALTPQTVTVTGQPDGVSDGHVAYAILTAAATSADPNYGGVDPADVTVTNTDLDDTGGLAVRDATVTEGDAGTATLTFTVTLSPPNATQVAVPYFTANGTATGGTGCLAGVDYLTANGTLTFAPGDTSKTVAVTVCADVTVEGSETVLVNLGAPTGGVSVADGQGSGTITDDDVGGGFSFGTTTISVPESAGIVTLTVQRGGTGAAATASPSSNVPNGSVRPAAAASNTVAPSALGAATVSYATVNGSAMAGQDFQPTSGTLTFGVNETTKSIVVPLVVDGVPELNETFSVTLSNPTGGATIAQATITVTILDTLPAPPSPTNSPDDDTDKPKKETEDERRQRARTNQGNKDDESTEGDVVETRCDQPWPSGIIANRDGLVEIRLLKEAQRAW